MDDEEDWNKSQECSGCDSWISQSETFTIPNKRYGTYCYECYLEYVKEHNHNISIVSDSLDSICKQKGFAFSSEIAEDTELKTRKVSGLLRRLVNTGMAHKISTDKGKPTIWISLEVKRKIERNENEKETGFSETDIERNEREIAEKIEKERQQKEAERIKNKKETGFSETNAEREEREHLERIEREHKEWEAQLDKERDHNFTETGHRETDYERYRRVSEEERKERIRKAIKEVLDNPMTASKDEIKELSNQDWEELMDNPNTTDSTLTAIQKIISRSDVWLELRRRVKILAIRYCESNDLSKITIYENIEMPEYTGEYRGFCIRTNEIIPLNISKPYSPDIYKEIMKDKLNMPIINEPYCHFGGDSRHCKETNSLKPICRSCWKEASTKLRR